MKCELLPFITGREFRTKTIGGRDFFYFNIAGNDAVAVLSGIGKVNAAYSASALILAHKLDVILSVGLSGALDGLQVFDIVIGTACVQHDADTTALGDPIGFVNTVNKIYFEANERYVEMLSFIPNVKKGILACGDAFIADDLRKKGIADAFNACACDMESGAVAQAADIAGIPFAAVRCISDGAGADAAQSFTDRANLAAQKLAYAFDKLSLTEA